MLHKITAFLEHQCSTFRGTLVSSGIYIGCVFSLGTIGLLFSYFLLSSPPWKAEYGFAFSHAEFRDSLQHLQPVDSAGIITNSNAAAAFIMGKGIPYEGFAIELLRLFILCAIFLHLTGGLFNNAPGVFFNNANNVIEGIPSAFSRAWISSLHTTVMWRSIGIVFFGLLLYHAWIGPASLAQHALEHHARYWYPMRSIEALWQATPSPLMPGYWTNVFTQLGSSAIVASTYGFNHELALFWRPYASYFFYSICTFMLLAIPATFISIRGLKASTSMVMETMELNKRMLDEATTTPATAVGNMLSQARRVSDDIERYSVCTICVGFLAWYEAVFGYRTLAPLAHVATTFALIIYCVAVGLPVIELVAYKRLYDKCVQKYGDAIAKKVPDLKSFATKEKGLRSLLIYILAGVFTILGLIAQQF